MCQLDSCRCEELQAIIEKLKSELKRLKDRVRYLENENKAYR